VWTGGGGGGVLSLTSAHVSPAPIAALLRREITPGGKRARIAALLTARGYTSNGAPRRS